MKIIAFGKLVEITKKSEWKTEDKSTLSSLQKYLDHEFPELKKHTYIISINQKIVTEDQKIPSGSEIALLPPFSGG